MILKHNTRHTDKNTDRYTVRHTNNNAKILIYTPT